MADTENGVEDELTPELRQRAAQYAGEDLSTRELILEDMQASLSKQGFPTEQYRLLRFLRACEFRMRQATDTITSFYKYKTNNPELFEPLRLPDAEQFVEAGMVGVLPGRDVQGGKVIYVKSGLWEPETTPMLDVMRVILTLQFKLIQDPETQIGGLRTLEDMEGLSWKHARLLSIPDLRKVSRFYESAFPARFEGFHHVNESEAVDRVLTFIKPFLSNRAKTRSYFHNENYEQMQEFIPLHQLPERYGGDVTEEQIKKHTMSLLKDYEGDDFGTQIIPISKMETKVASDTVVSTYTSGSYKSFEPS